MEEYLRKAIGSQLLTPFELHTVFLKVGISLTNGRSAKYQMIRMTVATYPLTTRFFASITRSCARVIQGITKSPPQSLICSENCRLVVEALEQRRFLVPSTQETMASRTSKLASKWCCSGGRQQYRPRQVVHWQNNRSLPRTWWSSTKCEG